MKRLLFISLITFISTSAFAQKETVTVKLFGDTAIISNIGVWENCAARFAIDIKVDGNKITMTERDTISEKVRCMCTFDVSASVVNLPSGFYTVEVYREYLKKYGYSQDATVFIGSTTFNISQIGSIARLAAILQGDCYNATDIDHANDFFDNNLPLTSYPNPIFLSHQNNFATISYYLTRNKHVLVKIFNALGQELVTLVNEKKDIGRHELRVDVFKIQKSGVYYCTILTENKLQTIKLVVMK